MIKIKWFVFLFSSLNLFILEGRINFFFMFRSMTWSILPWNKIKHSHCSTNAFPRTPVIALVLPSYLCMQSPFLPFPFAFFQHLTNNSFPIAVWEDQHSYRSVKSHKWQDFKWRNNARDLIDYQEETLPFSTAIQAICKFSKSEQNVSWDLPLPQ